MTISQGVMRGERIHCITGSDCVRIESDKSWISHEGLIGSTE